MMMDDPLCVCGRPFSAHGLESECRFFCEAPTPLTASWFAMNGFHSAGIGYVRYIEGYSALAVVNREDRWHWQLELHLDDADMDDLRCPFPRTCQPQSAQEADRLLAVLNPRGSATPATFLATTGGV